MTEGANNASGNGKGNEKQSGKKEKKLPEVMRENVPRPPVPYYPSAMLKYHAP